MTQIMKKVAPAGTDTTSNNKMKATPSIAHGDEHLLRAAILNAVVSAFTPSPREIDGIRHDAGWMLGRRVSEEDAQRVLDQLVESGVVKVVDRQGVDQDGHPAPRYAPANTAKYCQALRASRRVLENHEQGGDSRC